MSTLYRKYRPANFSEVVGQNHVKVTLENEIVSNKVAHAYLFCGPRAVGKTTFARILAKAVNCLDRKEKEFEPCNKCGSCQEINEARSMDIIEIDAASHTGVDNVRENVIASARVAPSKRRYKVFIIDEVHMLSISAFNALLKVIEEPPEHVMFILCTTEVHKVPSTIISRCQRFDFKRISIDDMVKKLRHITDKESIKIDDKILASIARQAEGHMRDAESLLGQIVAISGKEITEEEANLVIPRSDIAQAVDLLQMIAKKDAGSGIALVNRLLNDGVDMERFTTDLIEVLRKLLLSKVNPALGEKLGNDFGEAVEIKLNDLLNDFDLGRLVITLEKFMDTRQKVRSSFITQLPLELAIAEMCSSQPAGDQPVRASRSQSPSSVKQPSAPTPAPTPEQTPPTDTAKSSVSGSMEKQDFLSRWNEFLAKVKKYNHSLSFVLRVCEPRDVEGNKVCLAFKYKFHQDRMNEEKIREIVQKALSEVYGRNLTFEAVLDENMTDPSKNGSAPAPQQQDNGGTQTGNPEKASAETPKSNNMMNDLLDTFGGKVVG